MLRILLLIVLILLAGCTTQDEPRVVQPTSSEVVAFVAVHMETASDEHSLAYQETYWPAVVELVELADSYGYSLTLKFTPQWGMYIAQDPEKLAVVHQWQAEGHEIGLHHHGYSHVNWDGYTAVASHATDDEYLGDIEEMYANVSILSSTGIITLAAMTDEETDWPADKGILYETEGIPGVNDEADCCFVSSPEPSNIAGVTQLQSMPYATQRGGGLTLPEIIQAISTLEEGQYIGLTLNDIGFSENREQVVKLFDAFKKQNVAVKTVSDILSA